jgi:glucose-6-phosphate isomerase
MFTQLKSVQKLKKLAEHPIDLSAPNQFTPDRIRQMHLSYGPFQLLFGGERVTPEVLETLYALADEAQVQKKMFSMQAGKVINQIEGFESEKRSVLHTAMRDQFDHKQTEKEAADAAQMAHAELQKLEKFLAKVEDKFTDLIQIGIGGSDLGPRALSIACQAFQKPNKRVHFISNVDPDDANGVLNQVDLKKTLIVVVSKSGTTLETLTNEEFVIARLKKMGLSPKDHCIAVTGEKSPMDDPAKYLASFYILDFVGGRYSATSMVGCVCLGFALGYTQLLEILRGAHAMDLHVLNAKPKENLPLLSA